MRGAHGVKKRMDKYAIPNEGNRALWLCEPEDWKRMHGVHGYASRSLGRLELCSRLALPTEWAGRGRRVGRAFGLSTAVGMSATRNSWLASREAGGVAHGSAGAHGGEKMVIVKKQKGHTVVPEQYECDAIIQYINYIY